MKKTAIDAPAPILKCVDLEITEWLPEKRQQTTPI
jgi:hypothetical protein